MHAWSNDGLIGMLTDSIKGCTNVHRFNVHSLNPSTVK